jgi:hypothetical protein
MLKANAVVIEIYKRSFLTFIFKNLKQIKENVTINDSQINTFIIAKEYVFKTKELFFSFLIYEKTARITMHIMDYGPLGDGRDAGDQIEFWTESKVDDMPELLETIKAFYTTMK